MPQPGTNVRSLPYLSVPAWDISLEEIAEWEHTNGMRVAAVVAKRLIDGEYDNDQEMYPYPSDALYREIGKDYVDKFMAVLAERGMVRKSGNSWRAITPGRLEPSTRRAVNLLLGKRADLPPALAAELDSWKLTIDALAAADAAPAGQATPLRAVKPTNQPRAIAAG